jgi:hypothetical protein
VSVTDVQHRRVGNRRSDAHAQSRTPRRLPGLELHPPPSPISLVVEPHFGKLFPDIDLACDLTMSGYPAGE